MDGEDHPDINYTESFEIVLKKSAEHFLCLSKAHDAAARWSSDRNTWLTIPTIILSGFSGLGAVGSQTLLPFQGSDTFVGMLSFTCATLQMISSYYSFASRSANHKNASIQYAKLHQLVSLELSLPRKERLLAEKILEIIKEESSRLLETSPQFPASVIKEFKKQFADYKDISIPPVLNGLERVMIAPTIPLTPSPATPRRPEIKITLQPPTNVEV